MSDKKIVVSDNFVNIYRMFNVFDQVENIKSLSDREIYLLLALCLDKHDDELTTVKYNFQPFKEKVMEIFDIQDDKETKNTVLLSLIEETGSSYIETSDIVDVNGKGLSDPYTKEEIRDVKISIINTEDSK